MYKITKSHGDGYLGKHELLREIRKRLIMGKLEVKELEELINEYWINKESEDTKNFIIKLFKTDEPTKSNAKSNK